MRYLELVTLYDKLAATTKRLEKIQILAEFIGHLKEEGSLSWMHLIRGRVIPEYDVRECGVSRQLLIKALHKAYAIPESRIVEALNRHGDMGEVAEQLSRQRAQAALFSKKLEVENVVSSLTRLLEITGKGAVETKVTILSELLLSAQPREALYIVRTVLNDLRIGVADAVVGEAIAAAFFPDNQEVMAERITDAYALVNDLVRITEAAAEGTESLEKIKLVPGIPFHVLLPVKVTSIAEAFETCGKPAALEHKYDGFRMLIHKQGTRVSLFTRKLENVTLQFPEVNEAIQKNVIAETAILDTEVVGYNPQTGKTLPFETVSQRIRRKHDIKKLMHTLPVEINVFDILYYNKEAILEKPFLERRKILEKVIKQKERVIRLSAQLITDNEARAEKFYQDALKNGEEGIMIKSLTAPYRPGRFVGPLAKLKPLVADLDLAIVGAEYGTGKRGGWLTSYIVACKDSSGKYQEVGKVSSGLKEKETEGTTYDQMTRLLKPLILETEGNTVRVRPQIVVAVTYQNIQQSPSYSSGYALRFPRITAYRADRSVQDIASLEDIKREAAKQQ